MNTHNSHAARPAISSLAAFVVALALAGCGERPTDHGTDIPPNPEQGTGTNNNQPAPPPAGGGAG